MMTIPGFTAQWALATSGPDGDRVTPEETRAGGARVARKVEVDRGITPAAMDPKQQAFKECLTECRREGGAFNDCQEQCRGQVSSPPVVHPPPPPPPPSPENSPVSTRTGTFCAETVEVVVGHMADGTPVFGYKCRTETFTAFDGPCTGSPFFDPARYHTQCISGAGVTQCCSGWHEYPWIFASGDGIVKQGCTFCLW
jgi:hypothetical protein